MLEGIEAIGDRPRLWESRLPPELLRLPEDLARVDALLDDPVCFAPFAPHFHPVREGAVAGLNEAPLARAAGQKLLRKAWVQADTTVIPGTRLTRPIPGLLTKASGR